MNNKFKKLGDKPDQKIDRIKKLKNLPISIIRFIPFGVRAEPRAVIPALNHFSPKYTSAAPPVYSRYLQFLNPAFSIRARNSFRFGKRNTEFTK
jgi:hypothetical protein